MALSATILLHAYIVARGPHGLTAEDMKYKSREAAARLVEDILACG